MRSDRAFPAGGRLAARILSLAALLAWMYIIGGFSAQNATESSGLSARVSLWAVRQYDSLSGAQMSEEQIEDWAGRIETPVRKLAHGTEYAILALLACLVLRAFGKGGRWVYLAVVFSFLYAVTDEIHQTFVEGRAGRAADVLIDTCGALIAVLFLRAVIRLLGQIKSKYNKR